MTTRCKECGHEFINITLRRDCPRCGTPLAPAAASASPGGGTGTVDEGFDATGFAVGMMTGVPLSPTHGVSVGAILGAALHSDPAPSTPAPSCDPTPSTPDTSSYDSGSSSGGSFGGC